MNENKSVNGPTSGVNLAVRKCETCDMVLGIDGKGIIVLAEVMESGIKDCLMVFHDVARNNLIKTARRIFPTRPRGYLTATIDLSHYASYKATAINCRLKGEISRAMAYEEICEQIYKDLPSFARW